MKKSVFSLAILVGLTLAACQKSDNDITKTVKLNDSFNLKIGQTAELETDGMTITFLEVTEDSRCPKDVACIWEGRVVALFSVEKDGETLVRSVTDNPNNPGGDGELTTSFTAFGHTVTLEKMIPYPEDSDPIEQADYTASLIVQ